MYCLVLLNKNFIIQHNNVNITTVNHIHVFCRVAPSIQSLSNIIVLVLQLMTVKPFFSHVAHWTFLYSSEGHQTLESHICVCRICFSVTKEHIVTELVLIKVWYDLLTPDSQLPDDLGYGHLTIESCPLNYVDQYCNYATSLRAIQTRQDDRLLFMLLLKFFKVL